jgi:hypothetical protein
MLTNAQWAMVREIRAHVDDVTGGVRDPQHVAIETTLRDRAGLPHYIPQLDGSGWRANREMEQQMDAMAAPEAKMMASESRRPSTGDVFEMEPSLARVEFPLETDPQWRMADDSVESLAAAGPELEGWVRSHSVEEVTDTIRRAQRVRSEHLSRAENASRLENALREQLSNAAAIGVAQSPGASRG